MATTITKTKTGLNWGSDGITSGFPCENDPNSTLYPDYKDFTDNSFTLIIDIGSTLRRYFIIDKNKVLGNEAVLKTVTANFSGYVSKDRSHKILFWGNNKTLCSESTADDSTQFTTTSKSGYSLTTSDLTLKDSNYTVYLGATGKSLLGNTAYFTNVSFDLTYTIPAYTLNVVSNNTTYGTVSGGGAFESGATATITATPNDGYRFVKWSDGNTDATRTVTVSADTTYTAEFAEDGVNDMHCDAVQPVQLWADGKQCLQLWADGVKIFG